ncbi:YciI family protein [Rhodalgimonas zhirmunskyi]|uniref:YciI family protein n=1 Tax=Rhodalgimonas zhirmunskyi TaxID=2964767 RepID=A0AAJ1UE45_9RHOB|nr:YciI family protein [Rhodoalgimonas zhirmunskyi]MDQ2094347.1 YciI family protein [Rhodoalgimonas zhirmunskyi]
MLIALIARDNPARPNIRAENRPAHLDYLKSSGEKISMAGPLIENGNMVGSLIILNVADMAAAQDWADNDPYAKAGLFQSVELIEWKKVIG